MASLRRASRQMSGSIWPGFVDAITSLLMVLIFVLTIFMVIQSMLRDEIMGQENELNALTNEMRVLAETLGLEQRRSSELQSEVGGLRATLSDLQQTSQAQADTIASLTARGEQQAIRIASFEEQVASLLAARDDALARGDALQANVEDLEAARAELISEQDAMRLALASARDEIDQSAEEARLAAAKAEAFEALIAELREDASAQTESLDAALERVDEAERDQLASAAALAALRERMENSGTELSAMTLSLETARQEAQETLELLAAAQVAQRDLEAELGDQLSEVERNAALLATARTALAQEEEISQEAQRRVALLNAQVTELRRQLTTLQEILDIRGAADTDADVQISALTERLNAALAQVAAEEKQRAALEQAERERLEQEAKSLQGYRSEFFGRLRDILGAREGVRIVGDRFVFSSEVLFGPASSTLGEEGKVQIARVAETLFEVAQEIPDEINWVIRVDGHTDNTPLSGTGRYRDNWELSQARALSVVRYMSEELGFPATRLLAAGFGEYQPIAIGDSAAALAQNRRIELKLTEK